MRLQQIWGVRRWHSHHQRRRPVECQVWDTVLTLWVIGWAGLPVSALLGQPVAASGCLAGLAAPSVYLSLRRWLHGTRRVRCDWLGAGVPQR
jgi:hypothetical protein